jgi:hypothetical protein
VRILACITILKTCLVLFSRLQQINKQAVLRNADPGSGALLTLDPGWVKIRIRIRDEQAVSYFQELRNHFFGLKYLLFDADSGWKKFGSGINIQDPQHCKQGAKHPIKTRCKKHPIGGHEK